MIMKFRLLTACLLGAFCLAGNAVIARNPANSQPHQHPSYKQEAGGCNIPADQFDIDINNVRARLLDAGDQWWDLSNGKYEVPKGDITSTTPLPQAIFAGAIWVSALDQGNNLKIAALEYRQGTSDYYTGPLDNTGNVNLAQCNLWDMHFPVWATQIKPLVNAYVPGQPIADNLIADSVRYWPGKGNPYLAAKGYDVSGVLAPFYDANGDGIYNPVNGDYPTIKQTSVRTSVGVGCDSLVLSNCPPTYADEMVFWVMNDKGNVHTASNGSPMGIQVNELAFAFLSSDDLNNMTFYTYNIINKSGNVLNKTYMSQWTDVDLGCANNDRVGCDTSRSLAIQYNGYLQTGDNPTGIGYTCDDGPAACPTSEVGYGCNLPMLGIEYFEGPSDTTTTLNPTTHVRTPNKLGMTAFCYFTNGAITAQSDPTTASQFRNYMTGLWADGSPITYGGNGYGGSQRTNYTFTGDPSIATEWSECNQQTGAKIVAGDRRFVQTSGPFTFLPCASEIITIGVVFVDPAGGVGSNCPSFSFIDPAADKAKALFNACFSELSGPSAPLLDLRALDNKVIINIVDDPQGNNVGETYAQPDQLRFSKGYVEGSGEDSMYRFQGYIVYQLSSPTVTASNLTDPTQAIPIAVYDIQDNVSHLVNYVQYSDPITSIAGWEPVALTIPGVGQNLPNIGIQHSLLDSIDAIGGGEMVNHMTYYFGVISFATNNFKTFNPDSSTGQYEPFLIGKNFNKFSVIPENSSSTDGGRLLNSGWGTGTQVKRIEGQGNGGNYIDLDAPTIAGILNSQYQYLDTLNYVAGQDPLAFLVTDPVVVKEANFELVIYDTVAYNGVSVSPNAWWDLYDLTNNVTIHSVSNLSKPYQQIIADSLGNEYGFAITLGTPFPVYYNLSNDSLPVYGPIGGSITFADPSQPWLSFLKDSGQTIVNNWIRSGSYSDPCPVTATNGVIPDPLCNVFVDAYYRLCTSCAQILTDPNALFGNIAGALWSPYCLAANWSMAPGETPVSGRPTSVGGPGFKWDRYDDKAASPENNLEQLQSVDIVLTSDQTKWSQCVVFETGDNPILDYVVAPDGSSVPPRKGMLRNHLQPNQYDSSYNSNPQLVGLGWFPGYAVNVETGQRLNVAFGEASDEGDQNGRDMIWNPTSTLFSTLDQGGNVPYTPIFGGKHFLYVMNQVYDFGNQEQIDFTSTYYTTMVNNPVTQPYPAGVRQYYKDIMWTAIPYLSPGYSLLPYAKGLIPNDVTIKLRVQKPYNKFATVATNPADTTTVYARYTFSTKGLGPVINDDSVAKTALDLIRIVPNPYLAYSAYETSANDAEVKVTNLPNNCTIKIYTLDGVLVNTISRALNTDPVTNKQIEITDGYNLNSTNGSAALDNSVNWNMKNQASIPIASGIYLFDINVPGVGHKVLKWFCAVRPTDVSNF
jgi:hypothetical protein